MEIYKLQADIDGYTRKNEPPKFFYKFEDAVNALENIPGIYRYDGVWYIEGCKSTDVFIDGCSIVLQAIIHTGSDRDEWSINFGRAGITPVNLDVAPVNDMVYELYERKGYDSWLHAGLNGQDTNNMYFEADLLEQSGSKSYIKKLARTRYRNLPRNWNAREYERECSAVSGAGRDYISMTGYKIR